MGLQTGVIDGEENPLAQIWASRLYEVQKYLSLTSHVYTPAYVVVSPSAFDRLPEDVRRILESEARATQDFVYRTAETMDQDLLAKLEGAGIQVNTPDRAAFQEASRPVYRDFASTVKDGQKLLDLAQAAGTH